MNITGSTNIVGLIGNPVEHSFSPQMHNAAFKALNLDYTYVAFDVNPADLKTAINGAKSLNDLHTSNTSSSIITESLNLSPP